VSTYPAGFPDRVNKGVINERYETHGELYFQIHIRDKKQHFGPSPHVDSFHLHSFSYRIGDEPPVVLLSDYARPFWMQGNSRYEKRDLPPIPYHADGAVSIEIDFTLNGKKYSLKGDMPAHQRKTVAPTFIKNRGI
jgi:hypothetical protein